jgi:hypothetical protein
MTYANVAATLALIFSMGGGALAASHYLITSTSQIKPSVRAQLRGTRGPMGPAGPQGPRGGEANLTTFCVWLKFVEEFDTGSIAERNKAEERLHESLFQLWIKGCP